MQGRVTGAGVVDLGGGSAFVCTLEDPTGCLQLTFLGRTDHEEIRVGEPLVVEGTIGMGARGPSILNPLIHRM